MTDRSPDDIEREFKDVERQLTDRVTRHARQVAREHVIRHSWRYYTLGFIGGISASACVWALAQLV